MALLTQSQKDGFHDSGYLGASGLIDGAWLSRLNEVTDRYIELSRDAATSDKRFDRETDHSADAPRLRRLNNPVEVDTAYWEFASRGPFADIAAELLGDNVKFHHSKLNFKWSGGGEEVKWHQDIQFWPHTNYDVLTLGVYLTDVDERMAPMGVVPQSHAGPLYELYDAAGEWTGYLSDADVRDAKVDGAAYLGGEAGTITAHHCRAVHGSTVNQSDKVRPLLLCAYSCADAFPITNLTAGASRSETIVRGEPSRWARFDPRPCPMPPDWSKRGGYKSIFAHQQAEDAG